MRLVPHNRLRSPDPAGYWHDEAEALRITLDVLQLRQLRRDRLWLAFAVWAFAAGFVAGAVVVFLML